MNSRSPDIRKRVLALHAEGMSYSELEKKFGIGSKTITRWLKEPKVVANPTPPVYYRGLHFPGGRGRGLE
jgi:transposase